MFVCKTAAATAEAGQAACHLKHRDDLRSMSLNDSQLISKYSAQASTGRSAAPSILAALRRNQLSERP